MAFRSFIIAGVGAATLVTGTAPAVAQSYPGHGNGYGRSGYDYDRYRRRDNTGAVVAGVAAIGIIAAIAAASSHRRDGRYNGYSSNDGYRGDIRSENEAAQACAHAAQQRLGMRVSGVDRVYGTRHGFSVRGSVEGGNYGYDRGYGGQGYGRGYGARFTCDVRYGRVADVNLGRSGY